MERARRRQLARRALRGYPAGPEATRIARDAALDKIDSAAAAILVEGVSDLIALESLAARRSVDLDGEGIVIVPIGGAQAVGGFARRFSADGLRLAGMCDEAEVGVYRNGLARAGLGEPSDGLEDLGFHVCVQDLEDELIRAVGPSSIEALFDSQGDLGSFRTMQRQPAWRDRATAQQMRRFLGSGARRKLRYARLLIEAVDLDRVPEPLDATLTAAR